MAGARTGAGAAAWAEAAGRELRYLWFLVLIVVLAAWLIWGLGAKKK